MRWVALLPGKPVTESGDTWDGVKHLVILNCYIELRKGLFLDPFCISKTHCNLTMSFSGMV